MTRDEARAAWIGLDESTQRRLACELSEEALNLAPDHGLRSFLDEAWRFADSDYMGAHSSERYAAASDLWQRAVAYVNDDDLAERYFVADAETTPWDAARVAVLAAAARDPRAHGLPVLVVGEAQTTRRALLWDAPQGDDVGNWR